MSSITIVVGNQSRRTILKSNYREGKEETTVIFPKNSHSNSVYWSPCLQKDKAFSIPFKVTGNVSLVYGAEPCMKRFHFSLYCIPEVIQKVTGGRMCLLLRAIKTSKYALLCSLVGLVKSCWVILCESQFNNYGLQLYTIQKCIFQIILNSKLSCNIFFKSQWINKVCNHF